MNRAGAAETRRELAKTSSAIDAAAGTSFPVVRCGRLVLLTVSTTDGERNVSPQEADLAVSRFEAHSSEFEQQIGETLARAGKAYGVQVTNAPDTVKTARAQRKAGLGSVYDFKELAFSWHGQLVLMRVCVTVCPDTAHLTGADTVTTGEPAGEKFSKIWIRFILVGSPADVDRGSPATAALADLQDFDVCCRSIAEQTITDILPLYTAHLDAAVDGRLDAQLSDAGFDIVAVSAEADGFLEILDATDRGTPLAKQESGAAKRFVRMAQALLPLGVTGDRPKFLVYDRPDALRGVFLQLQVGSRARLFGLTRISSDDELRDLRPRQPSLASSNVVSAAIADEYGGRF